MVGALLHIALAKRGGVALGTRKGAAEMNRREYIETAHGQSRMQTYRQRRRFRFAIDQAPQSKNIRGVDAVAFQRALIEAMTRQRRGSYRGPVLLQLRFYNRSAAPPSIYHLSKNYLDLLETPRPGSGVSKRHLLYNNDRQVKGLVVTYDLTPHPSSNGPRIEIEAEPFRDFFADAALVQRIRENDFQRKDIGDSWSHYGNEFRDGPFREEQIDEGGDLESLLELSRNESSWVRTLGRAGYEAHKLTLRIHCQDGHLRRTDRFICQGLLSLYGDSIGSRGSVAEALGELRKNLRDLRFAPPFVLDLHHAPRKGGDTDAFRSAVRASLDGYKQSNQWLCPLSTLLDVTVVMVPPEGGGKDLDNLARLILPAVHEILEPPSDLIRTLNINNVPEDIRGWYLERLSALPKQPQYSIRQFRAFELPRYPNDSKEGFVRLAIGGGHVPLDFRHEIDAFIDRWQETVE
jgi:hypothetical protein